MSNLDLIGPWIVRYFRWLGDALQGDLGFPYKGSMSVAEQLGDRIGPTLLLMGSSFSGLTLHWYTHGHHNGSQTVLLYGLLPDNSSFLQPIDP